MAPLCTALARSRSVALSRRFSLGGVRTTGSGALGASRRVLGRDGGCTISWIMRTALENWSGASPEALTSSSRPTAVLWSLVS